MPAVKFLYLPTKSPEEMLKSGILSSQSNGFCLQVDYQRLGIDFWKQSAPKNTTVAF